MKQKKLILGMLLGTLGASFLENLLAGKGVYAVDGVVIQAGEEATKVGQNV